DFYRQALDLDLRGKREHTDAILSAMGGVSKMRLSQYKSLLRLSDEALELADRYSLDERALRPLLALPSEAQAEMIQQIIQLNMKRRQVKAIIEQEDISEPVDETTPSQAKRFVKTVIKSIDKQSPQDFAEAMIEEQGDIHMAFAYMNRLEAFIRDAKQSLES